MATASFCQKNQTNFKSLGGGEGGGTPTDSLGNDFYFKRKLNIVNAPVKCSKYSVIVSTYNSIQVKLREHS
jgi:hypothetical protein